VILFTALLITRRTRSTAPSLGYHPCSFTSANSAVPSLAPIHLDFNRCIFLNDRSDASGTCNAGCIPRRVGAHRAAEDPSRSVNEVQPPRPTDAAPSYLVSLTSVPPNVTVGVGGTENVVPRVLARLNGIVKAFDNKAASHQRTPRPGPLWVASTSITSLSKFTRVETHQGQNPRQPQPNHQT
jgi:hypothetical protein